MNAAVRAGAIASGADHYERYGRAEIRPLNKRARAAPLQRPFPDDSRPTRRDKILAGLDLTALEGLEIGALATPLVKPTEGNIFFVDHADTKTLRDKYSMDPSINCADIVEVGAVWGSQTLQECIGAERKVDYVVASHVIEHVPDLITWLGEIRSILRLGGSLRLAVPDRRYTFDYLRRESGAHDALDAYIRRARAPLPRTILEYFGMIREVDRVAAWNGTLDVASLKPLNSIQNGIDVARRALANGHYHDSHCWVFTPVSFAELCADMADLDLLGFACDYFFETPRNEFEFYVSMVPSDDKAAMIASWLGMKQALLQSDTYQKEGRTQGPAPDNFPRPLPTRDGDGARRGMIETLKSLKKRT